MVNMKQPPDWDDPRYEYLRYLAGTVGGACEDIDFGPLHGRHRKVLAVNAAVPDPYYPGVRMTLWWGFRDGTGKDGSTEGWWVEMPASSPVPLDPDRPGEGLDVPEFMKEEAVAAVVVLHKLLVAARDVHAGLVGLARDMSFRQINDAVDSGRIDASEGELYGDDDGDGESAVVDLMFVCGESLFSNVFFGEYSPEPDVMATRAVLVLADMPVEMTVWAADDEVCWLEVGGVTRALPPFPEHPKLDWPGADKELAVLLNAAVHQLREIHEIAELVFDELMSGDQDISWTLMSASVNASIREEESDMENHVAHVGAAWHDQLEEFTRNCRLGILVGVVVEESPLGPGLNARATTMDPVTRQPVALKVYWQAPGHPGEDPVHWLAADLAEAPAHGGDPMHPELLSGFAMDSRDAIRHAIDHLHDISDLATEVVAAREVEMRAMIDRAGGADVAGDASRIVAADMAAEAIEDALAALNGIARLYTGSMDRDVRNS